jgi:hypothetical protein
MEVLRQRGEQVRATVAHESVEEDSSASSTRRTTNYVYQLVRPDGREIPGSLTKPVDRYDVGDPVVVLAEPRRRLDPVEVDELGYRRPYEYGGVAALLALVGLCLLAAARTDRP